MSERAKQGQADGSRATIEAIADAIRVDMGCFLATAGFFLVTPITCLGSAVVPHLWPRFSLLGLLLPDSVFDGPNFLGPFASCFLLAVWRPAFVWLGLIPFALVAYGINFPFNLSLDAPHGDEWGFVLGVVGGAVVGATVGTCVRFDAQAQRFFSRAAPPRPTE